MPSATNINVNTFEDILIRINTLILSGFKNKNISIDLSQAVFIDPYSVAGLCLILRYANKFFSNISLVLPKDENVNKYLGRVNFFSSIPENILLNNKPGQYFRNRKYTASDVLLELTNIQNQSDINRVIDYSVSKIAIILKKNLAYNNKDLVSFCTALSETCQNIVDHSKDRGLVCVQKYHKENNYVIIGVADLGIGIKRSLSSRYNVNSWSHAASINNALQLGTSRFSDRGKGLYKVLDIVKKYKGELVIRSGSGMVKIGNICQSEIAPYFPGTQLYIKLFSLT